MGFMKFMFSEMFNKIYIPTYLVTRLTLIVGKKFLSGNFLDAED